MGRTFPIRTKCARGSCTAELERHEGCHGSQSRKVKSMSPVEKAVVHIVQELMNCTTEEVSQEAAREVYRWVCQQMPVRHAEAEFCCHNCRNKMLKLAQENLPNLLAQRRQRLEEESLFIDLVGLSGKKLLRGMKQQTSKRKKAQS